MEWSLVAEFSNSRSRRICASSKCCKWNYWSRRIQACRFHTMGKWNFAWHLIVVEPGQTVALVGHTGSGKSSIINVMMCSMNFMKSDSNRRTWYSEFSDSRTAPQDGACSTRCTMFCGDVASNIHYLIKSYRCPNCAALIRCKLRLYL